YFGGARGNDISSSQPGLRAFQANPPICAGSGLLSAWDEKDAAALIQEAIRTGILSVGRGFPRKNRVALAEKSEPNKRGNGGKSRKGTATEKQLCP
ncbi:MAG TPA: hypothetical protein VN437_00540, partial [Rectinemataceae bacterium]|nr:hypothetical protein [Rectinemataceae bacterium]